jgi:hypothetical protein
MLSPSYDLAPPPPPPTSPVSQLDPQRKTKKERQLADGIGGRVGEEPNNMTARKPGHLKIVQYSLIKTFI